MGRKKSRVKRRAPTKGSSDSKRESEISDASDKSDPVADGRGDDSGELITVIDGDGNITQFDGLPDGPMELGSYNDGGLSFGMYQLGALLTESSDLDTLRKRFTRIVTQSIFLELQKVIKVANVVDKLKRAIFYGENNGIPPIPVSAPTSLEPLEGGILDNEIRLLHSVLGLITEAGEAAEVMHKVLFDSGSVDASVDLAEEIGDVMWYAALGCDALGTGLEPVARANLEKLAVRFEAKGFTEKAALLRNVEKELDRVKEELGK